MSDIERGKEILQKLLTDDVIQIRPSDRERFMDEWRESMELIEQAARQAPASGGGVEPVARIDRTRRNTQFTPMVENAHQLPEGVYYCYTHPPAKVPEGWMPDDEVQIPQKVTEAGREMLRKFGGEHTSYEVDEAFRAMLGASVEFFATPQPAGSRRNECCCGETDDAWRLCPQHNPTPPAEG